MINEGLTWLHLDINPENILLHNGQDTIPNFHLIDMSRISSVHKAMRLAGSDLAAKVPLWLAPEVINQWLNNEMVVGNTNCVDSYSLSLVAMHLYSALCSDSQLPLCGAAKGLQAAMNEFLICMVCINRLCFNFTLT